MKKLNKKFELNKKWSLIYVKLKAGNLSIPLFECDYSNQNCDTDFTCTPSNWGHDCL